MFHALVDIIDTMDVSLPTVGCHLDAYAVLLKRTESPSSEGVKLLADTLNKKICEVEAQNGTYWRSALAGLNHCLEALPDLTAPFYDFGPNYPATYLNR